MTGKISAVLAVLVLLVASFSFGAVHAETVGTASLYIFGVASYSNGTVIGIPAKLNVTVTNGTGQVYLGSTPLVGTDTQAQAVVSTDVACQLLNIDCADYNFYYFITSSSPEVGGPSAGAAFAVAAMSVLTHKPLNPSVAMTGTANPDGSVGIVGDVSEKSQAAADQGIKTFLYPSTDNITSQAALYDERLGMIPTPVDSVYEAYQYFTGYNVTPVLNTNITTPLYTSLMRQTYMMFNAYQQAVYASLPSQSPSDQYALQAINNAQSWIQTEQALAANGDYYVAASDIVNASATDLVYAKALEELDASNSPSSLMTSMIAQENTSINRTYANITKDYLTNSSTLELKFIAIDRLAQASQFLTAAAAELNTSISSAAYSYALAEVKRASAGFWVSVLPMGRSNFSEAAFQNQSAYYLAKANSYSEYAGLLGVGLAAQTQQMEIDLNASQNYYDNGQYVASIFDSLDTIGIADLLIEENSITNGSAFQISDQVSNSALALINSAEAAGVTPFIGISYYSLGNSFAGTEPFNYIQFESTSREYTQFEIRLAKGALPILSGVPQPAASQEPIVALYQDFAYLVLGIALGVIFAGIVFEFKISKIRKTLASRLKSGRRRRSRK